MCTQAEGGELMNEPKGIYLVKDLMKIFDKSYHQVTYALSIGKLKGKKIGWVWVVDPRDIPKEWPISQDKRGECS
jgi:hypothetical protein